jgi:ABC-2 type transport system ATP-binding protein
MTADQADPNQATAQLSVSGLHHQFGNREVLCGLDFELFSGRVTSFLGRNGAGKTTTMNLLAGILRPQSGDIRVASGEHPWRDRKTRARIGYLPESPALYPDLTVTEQLGFAAALHGIRGAQLAAAMERVIECCDLDPVRQRLTDRLSKGYQQRVALAQAIIHKPDILLLDEPGSGLDPVQTDRLRQLIETLAKTSCVIFSTHLLSEALAIADDILVIRDGKQQFFGACEALPGSTSNHLEVHLEQQPEASQLEQIEGVESAQATEDGRWLLTLDQADDTTKVSAAIVQQGWGLREMARHKGREQQLLAMMAGGEESSS